MSSMDRRRFVSLAGLGAGAWMGGLRAMGEPMGLPAGIQLYAVRDPLEADAPGTLKALHGMGYREVETAGFAGHTAKEFRKMADDAGLRVPSAHLPFQGAKDLAAVLADANALGVQYATSSFLRDLSGAEGKTLPPLGLDGFKRTAEKMNEFGQAAKAAGLRYAYHNHNYEFEKMPDGSYGYDILLLETDAGLVKFEADCGWMSVAGVNPVDYFKRYPGRFKMLHVKDFKQGSRQTIDLTGPGRPEGVELGHGFIDYRPIFAAGKAAGIEHAFAEQEAPYPRSQLESAKVSYGFFHSHA